MAKRGRKKDRGGPRSGDGGGLELLGVERPSAAQAVDEPEVVDATEEAPAPDAGERAAPDEAPPPAVAEDERAPAATAFPIAPGPRPAARDWAGVLWQRLADRAPSFLTHVHPRTVLARSLSPVRTLGLGVLALIMALVLAVTGVLLMVYYVPSAGGAYGSIQDLQAVVPFGGLVRNIHRWAGHAMVLIVALHMLRVLLTGSYKAGRRGVWTSGVWLLALTLAFAFTGYLLPWDQLSYWAVSIGGHLARNVPVIGGWLSQAVLGGDQVTEVTLVRFYAAHVGILPAVTVGLVAMHLYRLRRAGGLARPPELPGAADDRVAAWPHLYERELALLAAAVLALIVAGVLFDAPLGSQPDIAHPDDPSKAPWYFLGLQELVSYSSLVGGLLIPFLSIVFLYVVPDLDRDPSGAGVWLGSSGSRRSFAAGALASAVVVPAALALREHLQAGAGAAVPASSTWLNPATLLLASTAVVVAAAAALGRSARSAVLALTGATAVAVALLTVVGLALRGASWALVLPWGSP